MPIRAEFRHLYRRQWLTVIRPRVLKRAHHQCERCKKPLHAWIFTYTWKSRDPQFSGVWRYHMIWIKEGAKVWRNQDGTPAPRSTPRACPARSASNSPSPTPTTIPPIWTTATSAPGAPGATSITTSPTTGKPVCQRKDAAHPFCAMPAEPGPNAGGGVRIFFVDPG